MYEKEVNIKNRGEIVSFLRNHFRYWTMNPWNRRTSYANNVKLYNLSLPENVQEKAWDYTTDSLECEELDDLIQDEFIAFSADTGYNCGFNGRSSGYLVLYDTDWVQSKLVTYPGRGIDMDADFDDENEWDLKDLAERVKLVQRFDRMCDRIRDGMIDILKGSDEETYEVSTVSVHRRLITKTQRRSKND